MKAFVFPGQGSQRKGMGAELFARFGQRIERADAILGYSLARLCLEDPDKKLNLTTFTQPAIYVVSYLNYLAALEEEGPPEMAAGHSVGEYAALAAAGCFDFELGLQIVAERARLMAQVEGGGLVAVLNRDHRQVSQLIAQAPLGELEIANINSPRQIVVGGSQAALDAFVAHCTANDCRALPLKVSGPFHTRHMSSVEQPFREFLDRFSAEFREPAFPVFANLTARPHRRDELVSALSRHLTQPVQWQQLIENMVTSGASTFVEIGRPLILSSMIHDIRQHAAAMPSSAVPIPSPRRDAAISERLGCRRPLLVRSLGQAAVGEALIGELARHGAMGILDTEGVPLDGLEAMLRRLNGNPELRGRFGVALSPQPQHQERQVELFMRHAVRCVEVRDSATSAGAMARLRAHGETPPVLLVRATDRSSLESAFDHAAAVYVELDVEDRSDGGLALLLEALRRRDRQAGKDTPLVGAAGIIGNPVWVQAMQSLGVDFVVAGSAFLLSREAAFPAGIKNSLRRVTLGQHRLLPDWQFPELASRSPCYVLDEAVAEQAEALQDFYLNTPALDWQSLQARLGQFAQPGISLTAPAVLDADPSPADVRHELQRRMQVAISERLILGDSSLWLLNRWLEGRTDTASPSLSAAQLLDWLCPFPSENSTALTRNEA